jgi:hypothetical protein
MSMIFPGMDGRAVYSVGPDGAHDGGHFHPGLQTHPG